MSNFMQLGLAAAQARRPAEALVWFERAVAADPHDPQARAWLGQSLCAVGRRVDGAAELGRAGNELLARGDIDKVCAVAGQLQGWNDFPGALDLLRRAAGQAPGHLQAQHLLAATCGQLNLTDEALAAVAAAEAIAPAPPMLQVFRAALEADAKRFESARRGLEAVLAGGPPPREAHRAHKELARVLDSLGAFDAAFEHLKAASALTPELPEFQRHDRRLLPAMIAINRQGFTGELMGRWRGHAFGDRAPVFVLGFFRSGTTLAQQVLDTHPDVFLADEAGLLEEVKRELQSIDPSMSNLPDKLNRLDASGIGRLRAAYWRAARGRYGEHAVQAPVFIEKFTLATVDAGLINTVFPDARIIFVQRDPRDVCLSCFMQLMPPTAATRLLQDWRGCATFYAQVMEGWTATRPRMSAPVFELRYETAVADFDGEFGRAFEFLGLDRPSDAREFHRKAAGRFVASPSRNQVSQPIFASSVGRWRRYADHFTDIEDLLAPWVERFHYG